jgi:hypothetical protein
MGSKITVYVTDEKLYKFQLAFFRLYNQGLVEDYEYDLDGWDEN